MSIDQRAHGIMFHHFHDEKKHPVGQGSITNEEFRKMIVWLSERYNILSADDWVGRATNNTLKNKDICLTFDDNLLCQYEIALPVLEEFNLKAFWFVYSSPLVGINERLEVYRYFRTVKFKEMNDFYKGFSDLLAQTEQYSEIKEKLKIFNPDEYLSNFAFYTREDKIFRYTRDNILGKDRYFKIMDDMINKSGMNIEEIAKNLWITSDHINYLSGSGHIIGLHSHSHPTKMKDLSRSEQLNEYGQNRSILTNIIDSDIYSMSHPCGSYNEDTLQILKEMNISLGFRSDMELGYTSSLEYPRIDHAFLIDKIR